MLTLGRKVGERVIINGNVSVEILSFDRTRNLVRLGFVAPDNVTIDREEVHLRKKEEQRAESGTTDGFLDQAADEADNERPPR